MSEMCAFALRLQRARERQPVCYGRRHCRTKGSNVGCKGVRVVRNSCIVLAAGRIGLSSLGTSGIREKASLLIKWTVGSLLRSIPRIRLHSLLGGEVYSNEVLWFPPRRAVGCRGSGAGDQAAAIPKGHELRAAQPHRLFIFEVKFESDGCGGFSFHLYNHWMNELENP